MPIVQKIREFCFFIATFNKVGRFPGGKIVASLLSIPLLMLSRMAYGFFGVSSYLQFFIFLLVCLIIIQLALKIPLFKQTVRERESDYDSFEQSEEMPTEEASSNSKKLIVLDKIIGILIVFWGMIFTQKTWKLLTFGFVIFHIIVYLVPFVVKKEDLERINKLPASLALVSDDLISGIIVNVILRIFKLF
ncbi:hypothetical protein KAW80_04045 [Candidatus Babeliales bacterium]|nr:hypothetical protein [Candidatus Babeliales bacterium]